MSFSEKSCETRGALSFRAASHQEVRQRAVSIGSAASAELATPGVRLAVHSVFASAVNLEVTGTGRHVVLMGPGGGLYPSAVALESPVDFRAWGLAAGSRARLAAGSICLRGLQAVVVELSEARRRTWRTLATIGDFTETCAACARRLALIQARERHPLTIDALLGAGAPPHKLAGVLQQRARALGAAIRASAGSPAPAIGKAVAALVGLGEGLTPSGDDFLCGFVAAVRAQPAEGTRGHALLDAICIAIEEHVGSTSDVSAALLRCMLLDHWPDPLLDLAEAIAGSRERSSLQALKELCRLGHSSGADIAAGFLFGLRVLPKRGIVPSASVPSAWTPATAQALVRDLGYGSRKLR